MARTRASTAPAFRYLDNGQIVYTDRQTKAVIVQYPHELPDHIMGAVTPHVYERLYRHVQRHRSAIGQAIRPAAAA